MTRQSQPRFHAIPTNLIMGFLGVGKTTALLELLKRKDANESWAVLVNEFGAVGIDGTIFSASGAIVNEVPGGCLCCAAGVPPVCRCRSPSTACCVKLNRIGC